MDEPDIRALLIGLKISTHKVTYTGSKKRARWMNISCPFAPWTHDRGSDANPSFGVTIDPDGRSFYKCLACGIHGRLAALPTKLGGYRNKNYSELRHWAELTEIQAGRNRPIPDWEDSIVDDEATDRSNAPSSRLVRSYPLAIGVPYLRARGITLPTVYRAGLRFDTYQHRVLFPCYDKYRTFRGFTGRSIRPGNDTTKGRNPKVRDYYGLSKRELFLGLPSYPEERGPRIISEGLFEFARGIENGYPATALYWEPALQKRRSIYLSRKRLRYISSWITTSRVGRLYSVVKTKTAPWTSRMLGRFVYTKKSRYGLCPILDHSTALIRAD